MHISSRDPLGDLSPKDKGGSPTQESTNSLYNPLRPTRIRPIRARLMTKWGVWQRTMRIRQIELLPVCNPPRALPRTAQAFAGFAQSTASLSLPLRATGRSNLSRGGFHVYAAPRRSRLEAELRSSRFNAFTSHLFNEAKSISPSVPPTTFSPGDPAGCGIARLHQPPVMDGHGNGPPQTTIKSTNQKEVRSN